MSQTIAVTAATGQLGELVIDELLQRVPAEQVVAVVRNPEKAAPIAEKGVDVRVASYDDPAALRAAFEGVDRVLLISGNEVGQRVPQHTNVVEAAKDAGVSFIGYTSAPKASDTDLILAPEHKATEEVVQASGITYSIMRNNWYYENYGDTVAAAKATGQIVGSTHGGRIPAVPRRDLAAGHAAVLTSDGHENTVYEFAGDEAWTWDDFASTLTDVLGTPVANRDVSTDEHIAALVEAGLPQDTAGFVAALDANIATGALVVEPGDLSRVLGRPTTTLREGVESLASAWINVLLPARATRPA
jgi:NAD(P)H dehydrogenase (quinone)